MIASLLAQGHQVTVLAPQDDHVEHLENMGCRFVDLPMDEKGINPVRDLALMRRMSREFARLRPDLVLGYTIKNNIYGALAARRLGIPFLPNVSGLGTAFLSGGTLQFVAEQLYRRAFRHVPAVFFQNDDDRALFIRRRLVRADQVQLLPGSGIDLDHFAPARFPDESQPPTFLMIGRLLRDKGVHEFVEAARLVKQWHPEARFQLLGAVDSKNRTAIETETLDCWQREGLVEYLGTSRDVREQIAASHCVVLPSYREGAPRTLIEAAAMARPLIASDVPGCKAVIDHRVTGYLCNARDAKSLADACLRFIALTREAQIAIGEEGREKMARDYDQAIVVDHYQRVIAEALA